MSQPQQSTIRNRLLKVLAPDEFERLAPHLEPMPLAIRRVLIAPNEPITHAMFVEGGVCSLIADTSEGRVEIGMIGYEGFIGVPLLLGTNRSPHMALVQADGVALRIAAPELVEALQVSSALRSVLGRYVQSLIVQVGQTVYANADANLEGRLARWILMTDDRLQGGELPLTHDFLSAMLSVRRPGVTTAVHILEGAGMIQAKRGRITVLDREKLMELAGDTYGPAETEYERLFEES
ncbi:cyclic nucleotide-binding protein [Methylorubrum extorquens]|uniref:Crp/Fnr family transcriptional regulator n=1 Tax=Methylorubrum extorquens TaxID=408 RepID=UPI00116EA73E|nr:Crp/Fnr family transcriptional regulator [Methylorubrum extorquens]GEL44779.1 cyclic nucleotide-binding protein [Methylorubrum extorquens]